MKIAVMQPYFFPYIGYFQLINAVDSFVIYDDIKYTKKGWINRNRILVNGKDYLISLPLKKDSDSKDINERFLSIEFEKQRIHLLKVIKNSYSKAPYYKETFDLVNECLSFKDFNIFNFIYNSIKKICNYLDLKTNLYVSSDIGKTNHLKRANRVIQICKIMNSDHYLNPIGGLNLYDKEEFKKNGITLNFIKTKEIYYRQFNNDEFIPNLSIIDVIMFNSKENIKEMLNEYELL